MRTAAICPTCATYVNALCVIYNGPGLTNINVAPLDDLETIVQNINDNLVPIYGSGAPTNSAVYEGQIYIDNATGDVYIATATGGGPADWVELALRSAIPSAPSLSDVLLVGNTTTTQIVVQDFLNSPTQTHTISPDNLQLNDLGQDLNTQYHVNDILVEEISTGNFLQIAIDNTQNQTITFPDNSGQLALLSDTVLDLQQVTDNGNLTTDIIFADSFSSTPTYLSNDASLLGYIGDGVTAHGALTLREDSDGTGFASTITADIDLTADRTISIPDADGTMVLSVNGVLADDQGDVTVSTIPYKTYVAKISQAGTNPPIVDYELENTLTNPVTFTYTGTPGIYQLLSTGIQTSNTVVFIQAASGPFGIIIQASAVSNEVVIITTDSAGNVANNLLNYASIELRIYP